VLELALILAVTEILKGNSRYVGAFLTQGHAHFSSECGFMVGLGKPKLCTKFEVASFSVAEMLIGKPQISGNSLAQGTDDGHWQTPAACQILSRWLHLLRKYNRICFQTTNSLF